MESNDGEPLLKKLKTEVSNYSSEEDEIPDYISEASGNNLVKNDNYYLDTVNRNILDFDFERICSISLSSVNVYCCLVCNKYFQGRSKSSYAYTHSVNENHHVFINLDTEKFYILPENYEITSRKALNSLSDIQNLLNPKYSSKDIGNLPKESYDLHNRPYNVGFVGLNKISENDYSNVILQALSHIPPIRDFYLGLSSKSEMNDLITRKSELNAKFCLLVRKIWSKHLFKSHVSPHELLQFISNVSKKSFSITVQSTPKSFLVWMLNHLHIQLAKSLKKSNTVFSKELQGSIEISTAHLVSSEINSKVEFSLDEHSITKTKSKFWILSLDLPKESAFTLETTFPEVSLLEMLRKYDGITKTQISSNELKIYKLLSPLPPYLILHIDRGLETKKSRGNPTVVKFPDVLDMSLFIDSEENLKYRLLACVKHELVPGVELDRNDDRHSWSINLKNRSDEWHNIKDLEVKPCQYELMFLEQSYIQIWERVQNR